MALRRACRSGGPSIGIGVEEAALDGDGPIIDAAVATAVAAPAVRASRRDTVTGLSGTPISLARGDFAFGEESPATCSVCPASNTRATVQNLDITREESTMVSFQPIRPTDYMYSRVGYLLMT
mmetsp:Transcript_28862/g.64080  ORF Transcript_28862/g.64080 Transcript_28862/m.64080 type:complete len:123 (+) Transcript_28862:772-1140(+)